MSIHFEVERTLRVSKEEAYEALLNLDAAKNWMQGFVRIERLDDGPMRMGSEWKETRRMFGQEATEHFEVIELYKPDKIVLFCDGKKGTTGKGEYVYTYKIESSGEHSKVTLFGEIKGFSGLTKLFGKMMVGTFKKACTKDLDALKSYLEKT